MRRLRMAPLVSPRGASECLASNLLEPLLSSPLLLNSYCCARAPYTGAYLKGWLSDTCVVRYICTPLLIALIVTHLFQRDSVYVSTILLGAWRPVLVPCGRTCFSHFLERASCIPHLRFRSYPPALPSALLLWCNKSPALIHVASKILVFSLAAASAVGAEALAVQNAYAPFRDAAFVSPTKHGFFLPDTFPSSSPAKFDAGDPARVCRYDGLVFSPNVSVLMLSAASRMTVKRCRSRPQTLADEVLELIFVESCLSIPCQKRTFRQHCYIAPCHTQSGHSQRSWFPSNSCSGLKARALRPAKDTVGCNLNTFSPGPFSPADTVSRNSAPAPLYSSLRRRRSTVLPRHSSCTFTLMPGCVPSYFSRRTDGDTRNGLQHPWLLSCWARYRQNVPNLPVASGTPRANLVACSATAESRAQALLEEIKKLTIVEVSELVTLIEQAFGVPAARAVVATLPEGNKAQEGETEKGEGVEQAKAEKKTAFSVEIQSVPLEKRIVVIKTLRTVRPDLGLKDAKGVIDALPNTILSNITKEKAEEARKILVDAGAQVEIK